MDRLFPPSPAMAYLGDGLPDCRDKLASKRVLVVEDEALVSMLMEDELRDARAEILGPVPSVENALQLVEAAVSDGGISAAVLDINLGGQHVAPLADRLAALGVPFLFATGYGVNHDTGGYGRAPVLEKPFDAGRLVATVAELTFTGADAAAPLPGR
ncbi:response regulator [Craurococcus roseus]|uniref:response regulator n=1 Tax=Craurococcus roseus TaxID=77585 RepID=UPI0031E07DA5